MVHESLTVLASVISSFSRAGLNVVDRKQFRQEEVCPLVIGYWNNLLPVLFISPIIFFTPASNYYLSDLFSLEIIFLAALIQCVAYSFSFAFKKLRVTDIAVLTKTADITVPLALVFLGLYLIPYSFFLLLPIISIIFIYSAGLNIVKKTYKSSLVLVLALTAQGVYAYVVGSTVYFNRGFWSLLSVAFSVLVWRFIFSGTLMLYRQRISRLYYFPIQFLTRTGFYIRGILTVLTQVTFIFAITAKNLLVVWPILNATGFLGAVFAYFFLGEKLAPRDFLFLLFAFLISGVAVFALNYEKL